MAKQTTIHAEVDKPTKAAIERLAKDNKVSKSVIVRWALAAYLLKMNPPKQGVSA